MTTCSATNVVTDVHKTYNKEYTLLYANANLLLIGFALNIRFNASINVEPKQKKHLH